MLVKIPRVLTLPMVFANGENGVKLYADRCDNMSDVIETQIQGLDARWKIWQMLVRRLMVVQKTC